ncbi:MAG: hypothetical protein LUB59_02295, partial [Candidatus Gastranaerophilales bacterium]|nr:hypothetical protein [Candidatus Gastranaerophilales bacterium]
FYIPYFILICHYAVVRSTFLVTDLTPFKSINFWGLLQNLFACDPGHIHETRHEVFPKNYYTLFLVWVPVGMMFTGLINSLRDKEKLNTVILLVISLSFGLFLFAANSRVIAFTGRYLIFISPFIFILTAIGLAKLDKYLFAGLIIFYSIACLYGLKSTYNQYWRIAYYSLKAPAEFVKDHYSGKDNLVIMPFASSVSFYYYKDKDMPEVLPLELFHEVRNPNNPNFYNNEQQKGFKAGKKYEVFQKIILGKKPISENFVNFMHSYIDKVPKGGYVIWIVYYTDNYAIIPEEKVQAYYSDIKNVKEHTMTGVMSKFDIDLINMLSKQFNFVWKTRDDSNSYFIFQKR